MLEGKDVNLRAMEKEDLRSLAEWANDPEFGGEYEPLDQVSLKDLEKWYESLRQEEKWFIIEKKDGSKIGQILCAPVGPHFSIGYAVIPSERNKGYCTEAVRILVDYLFLSKSIMRIQAESNPGNRASQMVLEKAGFKKEGIRRKSIFLRGRWEDGCLYSILREEWKQPSILTTKTGTPST